jgi:catechol 2,3-dioxygenase-like lactoylglutathione lyase family enzyme
MDAPREIRSGRRAGAWSAESVQPSLDAAVGATAGNTSGTGKPMIAGLSHAGFVVRDLPTMVAFSTDVLGLTAEPKGDAEGDAVSRLTGSPGAHSRITFVAQSGETHTRHRLELIRFDNADVHPSGSEGHAPGTPTALPTCVSGSRIWQRRTTPCAGAAGASRVHPSRRRRRTAA